MQDYCRQDPLNHGDAESVMEVLYRRYAEFDPIFTTVSGLCVEHERLAFLEGLLTLMMELAEGKSA